MDHVDLANVLARIKRWESRAKRAATALAKLERQRRRIEKRLMAPKPLDIEDCDGDLAEIEGIVAARNEAVELPKDEPAIPGFLQRTKTANDIKAAEEIKQELAAKKKDRAKNRKQVRNEKLQAKQSGATKKMPLSGKAALDLINSKA